MVTDDRCVPSLPPSRLPIKLSRLRQGWLVASPAAHGVQGDSSVPATALQIAQVLSLKDPSTLQAIIKDGVLPPDAHHEGDRALTTASLLSMIDTTLNGLPSPRTLLRDDLRSLAPLAPASPARALAIYSAGQKAQLLRLRAVVCREGGVEDTVATPLLQGVKMCAWCGGPVQTPPRGAAAAMEAASGRQRCSARCAEEEEEEWAAFYEEFGKEVAHKHPPPPCTPGKLHLMRLLEAVTTKQGRGKG
jgi:hypothetical protein